MHFDRRQLVFASVGALVPIAARGMGDVAGDPAADRAGSRQIEISDDLGAHLVVKIPVRRVVVFNRYNAEFVRAVAGSDAIVGLDANAAKDPAYWPHLHAARVGQGQTSPNIEAIIAAKPNVVFFPRNSAWDKARQLLTPFGIPVIVLTGWDVLKHESNIQMLGCLFQQEDKAARINAFYRRYRNLLETRLKGVTRRRVYLEEVGNYKTVLRGSGWHDMIEAAGGTNIFADVKGLEQPVFRGNIQSFDVDPEDIIARRPDVIVKLEPGQYQPLSRSFSADVLTSIVARPGFADLPATQQGQIYHISYYLAGACSKIVGAVQLAKWLHPDLFADIEPNDAMRIWLEDFQGVPDPGGYWTDLAQIRP